MEIRSITSLNAKAIPYLSKFDYKTWKNLVNDENDDDKLRILCVQEIYGYRVGVLGYIMESISHSFERVKRSYVYRSNIIYMSDLGVLSGMFTLLNRYIPFLNVGYWDYRKYMVNSVYKYYDNNSKIGMFDVYNRQILDGGCCIYANKKSLKSGFVSLYIDNKVSASDNISRKGITWSLYDGDTKRVLVITFNLSDDLDEMMKLIELDEIVTLQRDLESKYTDSSKSVDTYIIGDFKIVFKESYAFNGLLSNYIVENNGTNYMFHKSLDSIKRYKEVKKENNLYRFECVEEEDDVVIVEMKEHEMKEEEHDDMDKEEEKHDDMEKDEEKTGMYFVENPILNYFKRKMSPSSSSSNDSWTKI